MPLVKTSSLADSWRSGESGPALVSTVYSQRLKTRQSGFHCRTKQCFSDFQTTRWHCSGFNCTGKQICSQNANVASTWSTFPLQEQPQVASMQVTRSKACWFEQGPACFLDLLWLCWAAPRPKILASRRLLTQASQPLVSENDNFDTFLMLVCYKLSLEWLA